jgi:hypothetical protein
MSGPDCENEESKTQLPSNEATSRTQIYTPACPDNAPAVLTFSSVIVTKRGGSKKKLLNNVSGSLTGGLWAIMGEFVVTKIDLFLSFRKSTESVPNNLFT